MFRPVTFERKLSVTCLAISSAQQFRCCNCRFTSYFLRSTTYSFRISMRARIWRKVCSVRGFLASKCENYWSILCESVNNVNFTCRRNSLCCQNVSYWFIWAPDLWRFAVWEEEIAFILRVVDHSLLEANKTESSVRHPAREESKQNTFLSRRVTIHLYTFKFIGQSDDYDTVSLKNGHICIGTTL
jgi:hypothetical protein